MGDEYIKREDAVKAVANAYWHGTDCECYAFAHKALDNVQNADVAPVRHGRWYKNDQDKLLMRIRCSICNKAIYSGNYFAYCPICGARMDEEVKE